MRRLLLPLLLLLLCLLPALAPAQPALVASVREQAKAAGEMFRAAMRQEREAKNGNH